MVGFVFSPTDNATRTAALTALAATQSYTDQALAGVGAVWKSAATAGGNSTSSASSFQSADALQSAVLQGRRVIAAGGNATVWNAVVVYNSVSDFLVQKLTASTQVQTACNSRLMPARETVRLYHSLHGCLKCLC